MMTRIVNHGQKDGRTIGFPTVNLEVQDFDYDPGVYTCALEIDGEMHRGMLYFGPKMGNPEYVLEIYIVDFEGDLYGKEIGFEPLKFVRGVIEFTSFDDLKKQIEEDLKALDD